MKILVAGAGGFIAGHLVKDLLSKGNEVIACDIKPKELWYHYFDNAKNYPSCDLRLKNNCDNLTKNIFSITKQITTLKKPRLPQ